MRYLLAAVKDLALPARCACCGEGGSVVCASCRRGLVADDGDHWPQAVAPDPTPEGFPSAWAAAAFEGDLRTLISAHKDGGRRDVTPVVGGALVKAVRLALSSATLPGATARPVVLVPMPGAAAGRRVRGDRPGEALARYAASALPERYRARALPALVRTRRVLDQSKLTTADRLANQQGSMRVENRYAASLSAATIIVTDDVVTTGATLTEAARAIQPFTEVPVVAALVAATRRISPAPALGVESRPGDG